MEPSKGSAVAYLPERFADWEAGLACAELNRPTAGYRVRTMSADGGLRRSIGGLAVQCDLAADSLPEDLRLLILIGGETWLDGSNDAVLAVIDDCVAGGVPVAAICGACTFLARHGYLDACDHTGNADFEFAQLAPAYRGQEHFRFEPAVDGGAIITAAGARFVFHLTGVTMRDRQREHFLERVSSVDPALPERYRAAFGERYLCNSPRASENRALFRALCKQHGLLWRMSDIIKAYKPAQPLGAQASLF